MHSIRNPFNIPSSISYSFFCLFSHAQNLRDSGQVPAWKQKLAESRPSSTKGQALSLTQEPTPKVVSRPGSSKGPTNVSTTTNTNTNAGESGVPLTSKVVSRPGSTKGSALPASNEPKLSGSTEKATTKPPTNTAPLNLRISFIICRVILYFELFVLSPYCSFAHL
jgi:hypothetical protein